MEQKPVANAFRDVDTGAIKYLLASKKEDEEKLLAQFEDVCILTPKELADQLKAEREKAIRECAEICMSDNVLSILADGESGGAWLCNREILALLSTNESKENERSPSL